MTEYELTDFSDDDGIDVLVRDNKRNISVEAYEESETLFVTLTDKDDNEIISDASIDIPEEYQK